MPFRKPIRLSPHFSPRPWGGTRLHDLLGKNTPASGGPYGESWELSDHPGGRSLILTDDSAWNGKAFGDLLRANPREMIGRDKAPARYPLLVKFIDASGDLSVQVHPDDSWCRGSGHDDRGKSECWYVMYAEPGTTVISGYRDGINERDAREAITAGSLRGTLCETELHAGDFLPIPPGTVHAMMSGTLVCEIQQSSDTTFRLYDWDRKPPRDLHIEQSMAVTNWDGEKISARQALGKITATQAGKKTLLINEFFRVELHEIPANAAAQNVALGHETGSILNVVEGSGKLSGEGWEIPLTLGNTLYFPAVLNPAANLTAGAKGLRLLRTTSLEL